MSLVLFYRTLIIVDILLVALYGFLSGPLTAHHSENWQTLLEWDGNGSILDGLEHSEPTLIALVATFSVIVVLLLALVWNTIGIFLFWPSSRWLYLALSLIAYLSIPIWGITVITPWALLASELGTYIAGILLALMFFSPLATRFQNRTKPTAEAALTE